MMVLSPFGRSGGNIKLVLTYLMPGRFRIARSAGGRVTLFFVARLRVVVRWVFALGSVLVGEWLGVFVLYRGFVC